MRKSAILFFIFIFPLSCFAQLKSGFDAMEYSELMKMSAKFGDSAYQTTIASPQNSKFIKRSAVVGLDNCWDLWIKDDSIAVISIRGTTAKPESWLANFYAAMVPAKGTITISKNHTFDYSLADNPKAAIHTGWLISTAAISPLILSAIDSLYKKGIKNIIVTGHSQGGAIGYLVTAHLYSLQKQNKIPADVSFKTILSAGPKPGNLYFAYDYEFMTRNGRSYNVVNAADWVPESPFSVQTIDDLNTTNPFINAKAMIKKQKFPKNIALRYAYNKLNNPSKKARKQNIKFLGKYVAKMVRKYLPEFVEPQYYQTSDYARAGNFIILHPDAEYYLKYPENEKKVFVHHYHQPYLYLLNKQYLSNANSLSGNWKLNFISGKIAFERLFQNNIPVINIDTAAKTINGNNGCNKISGLLTLEGTELKFDLPLISTKMFCNGEGEQVFMDALKTIDHYSIDSLGNLYLVNGGNVVMKFTRQ